MKKTARTPLWPACAAAGLTLLAFSPVLVARLNNWEDLSDVFGNPRLALPGPALLRWALTSQYNSSYQPLGWLALAAMRRAFGPSALAFHLACLSFHAAAAGLAAALAWRLLALARPERSPGPAEAAAAAFAGALFAVHPLQAESVAMASSVAHLLGLVLGLAAALAFCWERDVLAAALFAAAALSRWMALPVVAGVLLLGLYPLRAPLETARRASPMLAVAAALAAASFAGKSAGGFALSAGPLSAWARAWTQFLLHWLWPRGLSPLYVLGASGAPDGWSDGQCAALCLALAGAAFLARRRWPALLPAWLFCGACLLAPSLMGADGKVYAHDRFAYLPCLALALAAAGALRPALASRRAIAGACGLLVLGLSAASFRQTLTWRDSETLWRGALAADPFQPLAYNRLGEALLEERGRACEAAASFALQARLDPSAESLALARAARGWCAAERSAR